MLLLNQINLNFWKNKVKLDNNVTVFGIIYDIIIIVDKNKKAKQVGFFINHLNDYPIARRLSKSFILTQSVIPYSETTLIE